MSLFVNMLLAKKSKISLLPLLKCYSAFSCLVKMHVQFSGGGRNDGDFCKPEIQGFARSAVSYQLVRTHAEGIALRSDLSSGQ